MFLSRELTVFYDFCRYLSPRKRFLQFALEDVNWETLGFPKFLLSELWLAS